MAERNENQPDEIDDAMAQNINTALVVLFLVVSILCAVSGLIAGATR